ncbi:hypothetical protein FRC02_007997 [Tulasnella sp. 418]|nr:hypothetical protein FRC02_007997 [Tulasnella sp. 418]
MQFMITTVVLLGVCNIATAKVVTVPVDDNSIYLDKYFLESENIPCDPSWYTQVPGGYMAFNFSGTSVSVIGNADSRGGISEVYLDNIYQTTVDRFAPSSKLSCGLVTFQESDLPYAQHNLLVIFIGNSSQAIPQDGPGYFDLSAIQYTVPDDKGKGKIPVGAIVGGVVGGVVALALIAVLVWWLRRRKSESNNPFVAHDLGQGETEQFEPPHSALSTAATPGLNLPYQHSSLTSGYHRESFQWDANIHSAPSTAPFTNPVRSSVVHPPGKVASLPQPHSSASPTSISGPSVMGQVPTRIPVTAQAPPEDILRTDLASLTTRTPSAPPPYEEPLGALNISS